MDAFGKHTNMDQQNVHLWALARTGLRARPGRGASPGPRPGSRQQLPRGRPRRALGSRLRRARCCFSSAPFRDGNHKAYLRVRRQLGGLSAHGSPLTWRQYCSDPSWLAPWSMAQPCLACNSRAEEEGWALDLPLLCQSLGGGGGKAS